MELLRAAVEAPALGLPLTEPGGRGEGQHACSTQVTRAYAYRVGRTKSIPSMHSKIQCSKVYSGVLPPSASSPPAEEVMVHQVQGVGQGQRAYACEHLSCVRLVACMQAPQRIALTVVRIL